MTSPRTYKRTRARTYKRTAPSASVIGQGGVVTFASIIKAKALALWSTGRQANPDYAGAPADFAAGVCSKIYDQIGVNHATGVSSPAQGTGTLGGLNYVKLNGTSQYYALTTQIDLTTTPHEVWVIEPKVSGAQVNNPIGLGLSSNTCGYRWNGNSNIDCRSTGNMQAYAVQYAPIPGVNVLRFKRAGTSVFIDENGEQMGSSYGRTVSGNFSFNQIGRSSTTLFSKNGVCEIIIFNQLLTDAEAAIVQANVSATWRQGIFVDATAGSDADLGWNAETAWQTVGSFISLLHRQGSIINLKYGEKWKNSAQPLAFNTTNQGGIATDYVKVQAYGNPALGLPIIDGGTAVAGSGMTVLTGTEYTVVTTLTSAQGCWAEAAAIPANLLGDKVLRLVQGTAGALTYTPASGTPNAPGYTPAIGSWAYTLGTLHVNVGGDPTLYTFQVAEEQGTQTSGFRPAKNYISAHSIILQYWAYDGVSFEVTQTGARCYFVNSRYNANDSFGGGGQDVGLEDCTGGYSGQGRTLSGPAGDMYSWHGSTRGYRLRCTGYGADKAGIDDLDTTTIINTGLYLQGCNQGVLCVLNGGGGLGTFINCIWVRESNDAPDIINCTANANNNFYFVTVFNRDVAGSTHGIRLSTGGNIVLKNAVFKGCAVDISYSTAASFVHDHCCVPDGTPYSGVSGGIGDITGDPLFTNETTLDFTLQVGSPCLHAGVAVSGVAADYIGVARANPPSIGAYEA